MTAKTSVAASPTARGTGGSARALLMGNARKTSQMTLIIHPNRSHGSLAAPGAAVFSPPGELGLSARACSARDCCSLAVSSSIIMRIVLLPGPTPPDQQQRRECEDDRPDHENEHLDQQRFWTDWEALGGVHVAVGYGIAREVDVLVELGELREGEHAARQREGLVAEEPEDHKRSARRTDRCFCEEE